MTAPARPISLCRLAGSRSLALLAVAVVLGAGVTPAGAQPVPPPPPGAGEVAVAPDQPALFPTPPPALAPELEDVPLEGVPHRAARTRFEEVRDAHERAVRGRAEAGRRGVELNQGQREQSAVVAAIEARVDAARRELATARAGLTDLAVATYVQGDGADAEADGVLRLDLDAATEAQSRQVLMRATSTHQVAERDLAVARLAAAEEDLAAAEAGRRYLGQDLAETRAEYDRLESEEDRLAPELVQHRQDLDAVRALALVEGVDFPLVVLDAYWKGAQSQVECGLPWWALAGIGRTESSHGTHDGSQVAANGDTLKPIIGIQLNGTLATAVITDTDRGLIDGDPWFDRAVGPMQFIPSTWVIWGQDGNGDGRADPNNLYDAALAAAAYLCAGAPMRSDRDLIRGFLSYNHDVNYAALVLQRAKTYGFAVDLGDPPTSPPTSLPEDLPIGDGAASGPPPPPPPPGEEETPESETDPPPEVSVVPPVEPPPDTAPPPTAALPPVPSSPPVTPAPTGPAPPAPVGPAPTIPPASPPPSTAVPSTAAPSTNTLPTLPPQTVTPKTQPSTSTSTSTTVPPGR